MKAPVNRNHRIGVHCSRSPICCALLNIHLFKWKIINLKNDSKSNKKTSFYGPHHQKPNTIGNDNRTNRSRGTHRSSPRSPRRKPKLSQEWWVKLQQLHIISLSLFLSHFFPRLCAIQVMPRIIGTRRSPARSFGLPVGRLVDRSIGRGPIRTPGFPCRL